MAKRRKTNEFVTYGLDDLLGYETLDQVTENSPIDLCDSVESLEEMSDGQVTKRAEQEVQRDIKVILNDMPDDMVKNMPTLNNRLSAYLSYYAAANLNRLPILTNFVRQAEEALYDPNRIAFMSNDELMATYKSAKSAMGEILETTRKVSSLAESSKQTETDEVYEMLKSLSPETLASLKDMLNDDSE